MSRNDTTYLIFSDSNINLLKLNHCKLAQKYLETVHNNGFRQLIQKATRIQGNSYSLIDHILIKNTNLETTTGTIPTDISDHFFTFSALNNTHKQTVQREIALRDFSQTNLNEFKAALNNLSWQNVLVQTDVNCAFDEFWNTFHSLFEIYFPIKKKKFNKNAHSINKFFTKGY